MGYKDKILTALSEMTEPECEELYKYVHKRYKASDKQRNCNHSMRYDMSTGGSTCTKCHWMS